MAVLWQIYGSRLRILGVIKQSNPLIVMILAKTDMADCSFSRKKLFHAIIYRIIDEIPRGCIIL